MGRHREHILMPYNIREADKWWDEQRPVDEFDQALADKMASVHNYGGSDGEYSFSKKEEEEDDKGGLLKKMMMMFGGG